MVYVPPSDITLAQWYTGQALVGLCANSVITSNKTPGEIASLAVKIGAGLAQMVTTDMQQQRAPATKPRLQ